MAVNKKELIELSLKVFNIVDNSGSSKMGSLTDKEKHMNNFMADLITNLEKLPEEDKNVLEINKLLTNEENFIETEIRGSTVKSLKPNVKNKVLASLFTTKHSSTATTNTASELKFTDKQIKDALNKRDNLVEDGLRFGLTLDMSEKELGTPILQEKIEEKTQELLDLLEVQKNQEANDGQGLQKDIDEIEEEIQRKFEDIENLADLNKSVDESPFILSKIDALCIMNFMNRDYLLKKDSIKEEIELQLNDNQEIEVVDPQLNQNTDNSLEEQQEVSEEPSTPKELQAQIVYDEAAIRSRIVTTEGLDVDKELAKKITEAVKQYLNGGADNQEDNIKIFVDEQLTPALRNELSKIIAVVAKESNGDIKISDNQIQDFLKQRLIMENGVTHRAIDLHLPKEERSQKITERKRVIYEDLKDSLDSAFKQYQYNNSGDIPADEIRRPTPQFAYFDADIKWLQKERDKAEAKGKPFDYDKELAKIEEKAAERKTAFKDSLRKTLHAIYTKEGNLTVNEELIDEFITAQVKPMSDLEEKYNNPAVPKEHPVLWFTHAEGLDENKERESRVARISEHVATRAVLNLGVSEKKPRNEKEITTRVEQDFSTSYLFNAADLSVQDLKEKLKEKVVSAKLSFNDAFANTKTFFDPKKYTTKQEKERKEQGIEGKEEREVIVIDLETVGAGDLNEFIDTLATKLNAPEMNGFEGRYQFVITGSDDSRKKLSALKSETIPSNIVFTTGDNIQTTLESIEDRFKVANYMMSPTSSFFMDAKFKDPAIVNPIPESLFNDDKLDLDQFAAVLDRQAPITIQLDDNTSITYTYQDYVKNVEIINARSFNEYLKQENLKDAQKIEKFKEDNPDNIAGLNSLKKRVKEKRKKEIKELKKYTRYEKNVEKVEKKNAKKYVKYVKKEGEEKAETFEEYLTNKNIFRKHSALKNNKKHNKYVKHKKYVEAKKEEIYKRIRKENSSSIGYAHWLSESIRNDKEAHFGQKHIATIEQSDTFQQLFREDYPTALLQDGPEALTAKKKDIGVPNMGILFNQTTVTGRHNPKARTADNEETRNSVPSVGRIGSGAAGVAATTTAMGLQAIGVGEDFTKKLPVYFFATDNAILSATSIRTSQIRGNTSPEIARALSKAYIEGMRAVMKGLKSKKESYDHEKVIMGGTMSMVNALIHLQRNGYLEQKDGKFTLKRQNQKHNKKDRKNNYLTALSSAITAGTAVTSLWTDKILGAASKIEPTTLSATLNLATGLTLIANGVAILKAFKDDRDRKVDFDIVANQIINGQQNDELTRILGNNTDDIETIGALYLSGASSEEIEQHASTQKLKQIVEEHQNNSDNTEGLNQLKKGVKEKTKEQSKKLTKYQKYVESVEKDNVKKYEKHVRKVGEENAPSYDTYLKRENLKRKYSPLKNNKKYKKYEKYKKYLEENKIEVPPVEEKYAVIIDTKSYSAEEADQLEAFFKNRDDIKVYRVDNPAEIENTDIWNNGKTERAILFTQDSIFMSQYILKPGMPQITTNISFKENGDEHLIGHLNYTNVSDFTHKFSESNSRELFESLKSEKIQKAEHFGLQVLADNILKEYETIDQFGLYFKNKIQSILTDESKDDISKKEAVQRQVTLFSAKDIQDPQKLEAYSKIAADLIVNSHNPKKNKTRFNKLARGINRHSLQRNNNSLGILEKLSGVDISFKKLKQSIDTYNSTNRLNKLSSTNFKTYSEVLLNGLKEGEQTVEVVNPVGKDMADLEESIQEGGQELLEALVEFSNKLPALYFRAEREGGTKAESEERTEIDNSDTRKNGFGAMAVGGVQTFFSLLGLIPGVGEIFKTLTPAAVVTTGITANFVQVKAHLENKKKNTNFDFDRAFADIYGKIYQKALTTSGDSEIAAKVATKATANLAYKSLISVVNMLKYADKQKKITENMFYASIVSAVVSAAGGLVGISPMQNAGLGVSLGLATAANANAAFSSDAPIRSFSAGLNDDLTNIGFSATSEPFADFVKTLVKDELIAQNKKVPFTPDDVELKKTSLDQDRYDNLVAYKEKGFSEEVTVLVENVKNLNAKPNSNDNEGEVSEELRSLSDSISGKKAESVAISENIKTAKAALSKAIGVAPHFIGEDGLINKVGESSINAMQESNKQYESNKTSLRAALHTVKDKQGEPVLELYEEIAQSSVEVLKKDTEGVVSKELKRRSNLETDVEAITDADGTINHIVTVYDSITGGPSPNGAQDLKNGFQKGAKHARYESFHERKVVILEDKTLAPNARNKSLSALKNEFKGKRTDENDQGESTLTILTGSGVDRAEKANWHLLAASANTNTVAFCENGAELMVPGKTPYKNAFQFLPEIPEALKDEAKQKLDTIRDILDAKIKNTDGDEAVEVPGKGISGIYLEPGKQHGMTVHFTYVKKDYLNSMAAINEAYSAVLDLFQKLANKYEAAELFVVKKSDDWVEKSSAAKKLIQPLLDNIDEQFERDIHNTPRISTYSGDSGSDQDGMLAVKKMVAKRNEKIDAHNADNPHDRIPRSHTLIMGVLNQSPLMRDRALNKPDGTSYADFFVLGGPDHHAHILGNHELTHKLTELKTIFIHNNIIQTEDKQGNDIKQCKKPVQIVDDKGLTLIVNFDKLGNSLNKLKKVLDDIKDNPNLEGNQRPKIVIRDCNLSLDKIREALGDDYMEDVFFLKENQVHKANGEELPKATDYKCPYLPFHTQGANDQKNIFDPLNQEMEALYRCSDTFEPHRNFYENRHQYVSKSEMVGEQEVSTNPYASLDRSEPIPLFKNPNLDSISEEGARQSAMRDDPRKQGQSTLGNSSGSDTSKDITPTEKVDLVDNMAVVPKLKLKGFLSTIEKRNNDAKTKDQGPENTEKLRAKRRGSAKL